MRRELAIGPALAASLAACTGAIADPAPAPVPPAQLEDPCVDDERASGEPAGEGAREGISGGETCRRALDHFAAALAAQRAGEGRRALRISFHGDSLVGGDDITHVLRRKLGALVGDGGPGFVYAVPPHPYCRHRAVTRLATGAWQVHAVSNRAPSDRLLGLGGSAEAEAGGTIRLAPASPVAFADVHYLAQPHGGGLAVTADGAVLAQISTARGRKQSDFVRVALPPHARRIELRAAGRVRLFGATLEAQRGAVVDNLGVINATVLGLSSQNLLEHWQNQLARRDADLVILMLGANEAEWLVPGTPGMADHERRLGRLLAAVRAATPDRSCLVISPLDQLDWRAEGAPPRASVPAMVEAQRRAAAAAGCAFWDAYRWMGGKGSSRGWYQRGLLVNDFQHPTAAGAARIADALYAGLVP